TGDSDIGRARGDGFLEEVVAERRKAGLVGKGRKRQLTDVLKIGLALYAREYLPGSVDDDLDGTLRHYYGGGDIGALHPHQLADGGGGEGTRPGVERAAVSALDLEPALAGEGQVELVARARQGSLHVDVAHGAGLDAEADGSAFGNDRGVGPVRHALQAVHLVKKVGKLGA